MQTFLASETARKRYWAGSHLGWRTFGSAQPNAGHLALAQLEAGGVVSGVVTQNVDGLHRRAGSRHVVELHGGMDRVVCLHLRAALRPAGDRRAPRGAESRDRPRRRPSARRPDGDVEVDDVDAMVIPACTVCGGILKPDVVFFGEFVPVDDLPGRGLARAARRRAARRRLVARRELGRAPPRAGAASPLPIIVVNRGITKGDSRAAVKIDAGASETLVAFADALTASNPASDALARISA